MNGAFGNQPIRHDSPSSAGSSRSSSSFGGPGAGFNNRSFSFGTPAAGGTSATSATSNIGTPGMPSSVFNAPASAFQNPMPSSSPSVLLFPHQHRSQGTSCEVARLLKARCQALVSLQLGRERLDAFTAIVMQVGDVRDEQKPSVLHMLLAQIPLLPESVRAEALRDIVTLAAGLEAGDQAQVYAQVAKASALLAPGERTAALRSLLVKANSLVPELRATLLPVLAGALSSLPDADAQQTLLTVISGLIDNLPAPLKLPVAEALAAVSWLSDAARLAGFNVALGTIFPNAGPDSRTLLSRLAVCIPQLPAAAHAKAFRVLLGLCANWPTQNAGVIDALRSVAGSLTKIAQPAALELLAAVDRLAPQASGAAAGITYTGFIDSLAAVGQRSPSSQASELLGLAALLADLPGPQRADAFAALFKLAAALRLSLRATPLGRLAEEICMLPQPDRLAAWTRLLDQTGKLPDRCRAELLAALCGQVDSLPDTARGQALQSLQALASRLAMPDAALLHALAGVIACLPKEQRMPAFKRLHASLQRMQAKAAGALAMALAAVLPQLPETGRQAALELLAVASEGLAAKHRPPLLVLLAQALSTIPAAALLPSVRALLHPLYDKFDPLLPPHTFSSATPDSTPVSMDGLRNTLRGAREYATALPMPDHERTMVLCAIVAGLENCSKTACAEAIESVLDMADDSAWLAVLDCAVPLLLKRPPSAKHRLPQEGSESKNDLDTLFIRKKDLLVSFERSTQVDGADLVLQLCAILGSTETDARKHQMIWGAEQQSYFYRLATDERVDEKRLIGFVLPLLLSSLPEDLSADLLAGHAVVGQEQATLGMPGKSAATEAQHHTCVAMALVVHEKCALHKTLTDLVMHSNLPAIGKLAALSGRLGRPPAGPLPALNALAALVRDPLSWNSAFETQIKTILHTVLATAECHPLLFGTNSLAAGKTVGVHKSTALLTALAVDNQTFVHFYTSLILDAELPDESKVALCGRRADVNNEAEVEACFKAASADTRSTYAQAVRQSTLSDPDKRLLLRYC